MELYLNILLQIVFLFSLVGILHTYGLYPFLMEKLDFKGETHDRELHTDDDDLPVLNVVMAMFNEEAVIKETIQSIVNSDYPEGKLNVFIASDDSTDNSRETVEKLESKFPFVHLEIFEDRQGKVEIINHMVEQVPLDDQSVLILCDANVIWTPGLARSLARHFKDRQTGVVASSVKTDNRFNRETVVQHSEGIIWGRMMVDSGACYAIRRNLFEKFPDGIEANSLYQILACYEQGYDGVVDREAIGNIPNTRENPTRPDLEEGIFKMLKRFFGYLLPWNCGLPTFAVFWSHIGLRWFTPYLLLLIILSSFVLACQGRIFYILTTLVIAATVFAAWLDSRMEHRGQKPIRLFRIFRCFYTKNYSRLLTRFGCFGSKKEEPIPPIQQAQIRTNSPGQE